MIKKKKWKNKTIKKVKLFVLFLFLSAIFRFMHLPSQILSFYGFAYCIVAFLWFLSGLFLLGYVTDRKNNDKKSSKED